MSKAWTEEEDELIVKLRKEGFTAREIAVRVARTEGAVRVRLAAKAKTRREWTEDEVNLALELRSQGVSLRRIAYKLGRTSRAVQAKLLREPFGTEA